MHSCGGTRPQMYTLYISTIYLDKAFPFPPIVAAFATEEPPSRLTVLAIASPFSANELELALVLYLAGGLVVGASVVSSSSSSSSSFASSAP